MINFSALPMLEAILAASACGVLGISSAMTAATFPQLLQIQQHAVRTADLQLGQIEPYLGLSVLEAGAAVALREVVVQ